MTTVENVKAKIEKVANKAAVKIEKLQKKVAGR